MRVPSHVALSLALALALVPRASHASIFGEENVSLAALVVQASEQLTALRQQLQLASQTYNETRKYVGMLADAKQAFADMQSFGTAILTNPDQAFANLMPEASYLRYQLTTPENWAQGTGELQNRVRMCLAAGNTEACTNFYEPVRAEMARRSISATFGTAPPGHRGEALEVVDTEAARVISDSTANAGRSAKNAAVARALREQCLQGTSSDAMAACQAAANLGTLVQLEEMAVLNQQTAEANRLKALELAQKNGELKREFLEAEARRKAIRDGYRDMQNAKLGGAGAQPLESPLLPRAEAP